MKIKTITSCKNLFKCFRLVIAKCHRFVTVKEFLTMQYRTQFYFNVCVYKGHTFLYVYK